MSGNLRIGILTRKQVTTIIAQNGDLTWFSEENVRSLEGKGFTLNEMVKIGAHPLGKEILESIETHFEKIAEAGFEIEDIKKVATGKNRGKGFQKFLQQCDLFLQVNRQGSAEVSPLHRSLPESGAGGIDDYNPQLSPLELAEAPRADDDTRFGVAPVPSAGLDVGLGEQQKDFVSIEDAVPSFLADISFNDFQSSTSLVLDIPSDQLGLSMDIPELGERRALPFLDHYLGGDKPSDSAPDSQAKRSRVSLEPLGFDRG